jgi:hypothetical protein
MLESTVSEADCRARVFSELSYLPTDITEVNFSIRRYRARFRNDVSFALNCLTMHGAALIYPTDPLPNRRY